jgi:hypothetical protein
VDRLTLEKDEPVWTKESILWFSGLASRERVSANLYQAPTMLRFSFDHPMKEVVLRTKSGSIVGFFIQTNLLRGNYGPHTAA